MAEPLRKIAIRRLLQYGWGMVLGMTLVAAYAEEVLPDPTRPPASLSVEPSSAIAKSGPVLQSVLISPGRRVAIISGQTVRVGDKIGDARVTGITENAVKLSSVDGMQTLKLFPAIEKKLSSGGPDGKSKSRRQ